MLSAIPLFGLPHKVTIVNLGSGLDKDDGAGGIIPADDDENIYVARQCRITTNSGVSAERPQGMDTDEMWQVIMLYSPDVKEGQYVIVGADSIAPAGRYKIVKVKHQIDHTGAFHHTSLLLGQS